MVCRAGALPAPSGADLHMDDNPVYINIYPGENVSGVIYEAPSGGRKPASSSFSGKVAAGLAFAGKITLFLSIFVFFVSFAPAVWYKVRAFEAVNKISLLLAETAKDSTFDLDAERKIDFEKGFIDYQPRFDSTLPAENMIKIPSIGVYGRIYEAPYEIYESALKKGVWRASDFSTPTDQSKPTILVAHRYGYLAWSNSFRRKNSFYNLPKLKEGDIIEIYWNQRKYVYEVYRSERGEEISDYSADLILYTCESLNSPVRIFKYARLLKI